MSQVKQNLSLEEKRQIVTKLAQNKILPLSSTQEKSWLYQQMDPKSPAYNVPLHLKITGPLNLAALEKAMYEIIKIHEACRIRFMMNGDQPIQTLTDPETFQIKKIDLSKLSSKEKLVKLGQIKEKNANEPFQMINTNLFEVQLIQNDHNEHWLLFRTHQAICDGISMHIIMRDLKDYYKAFVSDISYQAPEVSGKGAYFNYVRKQLQWDKNKEIEYKDQIDYWSRKLKDAPLKVDIPRDYKSQALGESVLPERAFISSENYSKAKIFCQQHGMTPFVLVLSSFQISLAKWTQQTDISIGSIINSRGEFDDNAWLTAGEFTNPVVFRGQVNFGESLISHLDQVKGIVTDAQSNAKCPFKYVVEKLNPKRLIDQNPFFNISLIMHVMPDVDLAFSEEVNSELETPSKKLGGNLFLFDIMVQVHIRNGGLEIEAEYNDQKFNKKNIERILLNTVKIMNETVSQCQKKIGDIKLVDKDEENFLTKTLNSKYEKEIPKKFLHELFEEQSRHTPDAIALRHKGNILSYKELNLKVNELAHYLQSKGIGPNKIVGLCLERSFELFIAILATMKSGGAYVPLDTEDPKDRYEFILNDTKTSIVLTQKSLENKFQNLNATTIVTLDSSWQDSQNAYSKDSVICKATLDDTIYVIYTSGSTGQPKGCVNTHRGLSNYVFWMKDRFHADDKCVIFNKTQYTFDVSFPEMIFPLISGSQVLILSAGGQRNPNLIIQEMITNKVTAAHFVPSMLGVLLDHPEIRDCNSLKLIVAIGEALPPTMVKKFYEVLPEARLVNEYGPTEAAVAITTWNCSDGDNLASTPIGYPTPNGRVYILDQNSHVVPFGMIGELYIGGVQVAMGYLGRADLTAQRFLPDPFVDSANAKMYKTGDLCRYLPDGAIEYLGRSDLQIKIRGFRIELGEIESVLLSHSSISEAAVVSKNLHGEGSPPSLIAYYVSRKADLVGDELKKYLSSKLPEYMIPALIIPLSEFPHISSGKTDRQSLNLLPINLKVSEREFVTPKSETEERILRIFKENLKIEQMSTTDNFFDLGGHSLLAAKLVNSLNSEFLDRKLNLPISSLFLASTVQDMSNLIEQNLVDRNSTIKMKSGNKSGPLFFIHTMDGSVLPFVSLVHNLKFQQEIYGLQANDLDLYSNVYLSFEKIASNLVEQIEKISADGPYRLAGWSLGASLAVEVTKQLEVKGKVVEFLGLIDAFVTRPSGLTVRDHYIKEISQKNATPIAALEAAFSNYYADFKNLGSELSAFISTLESSNGKIEIERIIDYSVAYQKYSLPRISAESVFLFESKETNFYFPQYRLIEQRLSKKVTHRIIPGDHFSILKDPNVEILAHELDVAIRSIDQIRNTKLRA